MKSEIYTYDKTNPESLYKYSQSLIGYSLREWMLNTDEGFFREQAVAYGSTTNKGKLGQNVEHYFFGYQPNSSPAADFKEAGIELKCTGLKSVVDKHGNTSLKVKERLVCDIINYMEVLNEPFEHSVFLQKCLRMLIMFYLYQKGVSNLDLKFIKVALWKLPEKDLLILKHDYQVIVDKVKAGKAHEISESDTLYLAAARKGAGGEVDLRHQPNSSIMAYQRAFSLKPAYVRSIVSYIDNHGGVCATNFYEEGEIPQLVSEQELRNKSFTQIILDRFQPFYNKNYVQIVNTLGLKESAAKHKYALVANAILRIDSPVSSSKVEEYEEFRKSGIVMKTVRVNYTGSINESMSFENIDYEEIYDNDIWEESRLYEILTTQFLFVVFKETCKNSHIVIAGKEEPEFVLDHVCFWSMPQSDLEEARLYWENIREAVRNNKIQLDSFYSIADHKKFHVRPKGTIKSYKKAAVNPNGGMADKYCYWFNSEYVKMIINK